MTGGRFHRILPFAICHLPFSLVATPELCGSTVVASSSLLIGSGDIHVSLPICFTETSAVAT